MSNKIKLKEVKLKNDCFAGGTVGYYNTTDVGTNVEELWMDWERREITVKLRGQLAFQLPFENIIYKRNADVSKPKKKAKKSSEPKFKVEDMDSYPGE